MAQARVRRATVEDAGIVATLQVQMWQQAYADLLPAGVVLTDPTRHASVWEARIRGGGPVFVAEEGSEPVGFAAVAAELDQRNLLAPVGEIEVLHVVPRWSRRGHGGRLLVETAASLRRMGARSARWWIPQADSVTAGFLARAGWSEDGLRRQLDTGADPLFEVRFSGSVDLVSV